MTLSISSRGPDAMRDRYRDRVEFVLRKVALSHTGRTVLKYLRGSRHRVRIVPFGPRDAETMRALVGTPRGAYARPGHFYNAGPTGPRQSAHGTGAEVHFTPGLLQERSARARDHVVLVHELAHALRATSGTARIFRERGRLWNVSARRFDTVEELFAQMVDGTHSSELGLGVRADGWQVGRPTPDYLRDQEFALELRYAAEDLPGVVEELARADAPFNPWRDIALAPA